MKRKTRIVITLLFIVMAILFYNLFYDAENKKESTVVTNVVDGDTIVVSGGERVRLLGMDTPEKGEFFYGEAKKRLEQLIENQEVMLEQEGDNKDQYDRLLRYIFINNTNINMKMVEEGYANCYFYAKSKYQETCKSLEQNAIQNKIGRWQKA